MLEALFVCLNRKFYLTATINFVQQTKCERPCIMYYFLSTKFEFIEKDSVSLILKFKLRETILLLRYIKIFFPVLNL